MLLIYPLKSNIFIHKLFLHINRLIIKFWDGYKKTSSSAINFNTVNLNFSSNQLCKVCVSGCARVRESGHLQAWSAAAGRRQGTRQGRGHVESCVVLEKVPSEGS